MAGVINYFHGESGIVTAHQVGRDGHYNVRRLRLRENPCREFARDYGSDVAIDPSLAPGERAVYVRVDEYAGIWVRAGREYYPELQRAIDRAMEWRLRDTEEASSINDAARGLHSETEISGEMGAPRDNSVLRVSFFISFSADNVLLARQISEDVRDAARCEVWFDLENAGEAPRHDAHIERWLKNALYAQQGFLLLWTRAAAESKWVQKELAWAVELAQNSSRFRFVLLKLDGTPLPERLAGSEQIVDCHGVSAQNGLTEELVAAVTGRRGRMSWIREHGRRGIPIRPDEDACAYEPYRSYRGIAVGLKHWIDGGQLRWELSYESEGILRLATGTGLEEAVDLGIKAGDLIGFYVCHRAPHGRFNPGTPVWMRSADLRIQPEDVVAEYKRCAAANLDRRWWNIRDVLSMLPAPE